MCGSKDGAQVLHGPFHSCIAKASKERNLIPTLIVLTCFHNPTAKARTGLFFFFFAFMTCRMFLVFS